MEAQLVVVLVRAANQHARHAEIEEKHGPSLTAQIYQLVAAREPPESYDSGPLTERRLESVWASRTRLL